MRLKRTIAILLIMSMIAPGLLCAQEDSRQERKDTSKSYLQGRMDAESEHGAGGFAYRALNNAGRHYAPDPTLSDEPLSRAYHTITELKKMVFRSRITSSDHR